MVRTVVSSNRHFLNLYCIPETPGKHCLLVYVREVAVRAMTNFSTCKERQVLFHFPYSFITLKKFNKFTSGLNILQVLSDLTRS
jgi:hypothetical protein